jgi:hypothetical protein
MIELKLSGRRIIKENTKKELIKLLKIMMYIKIFKNLINKKKKLRS